MPRRRSVKIASHFGRFTSNPYVPSGSNLRVFFVADTAFSGTSRRISPPIPFTNFRRSVSWLTTCSSRSVDSRADKIHRNLDGSTVNSVRPPDRNNLDIVIGP